MPDGCMNEHSDLLTIISKKEMLKGRIKLWQKKSWQ